MNSVKRFFMYTFLQTKKILRTFPSMIIMTGLLSLVLGAMLYMQTSRASASMTGDEDSRIAVGISGSDSSPYLDLGLSMLEKMDPSRAAVRFERLERSEALDKLRSGSLSAVIDMPEGLTDRLLSGDTSASMTLILPNADASFGPLLIRELSACISSMISQMESASFALSDYYSAAGVTDSGTISDAQTDLLYTGLKKILQRGHLFTLRRMKTDATITIESYYLCAMFLLLVLLIGVMCAGNFIRPDRSLETLLRVRGMRSASQVLAEYLSLLLFLLLLGAVFIPAIGFSLTRMPIVFAELDSQTPFFMKQLLLFSLKAFPVVLMTAAMDLLLYEISDSLISGVLLQFLVVIALSCLSGVFYPVSSLPSVVRAAAPYLPTGQAMLYLRKSLISGRQILPHASILILYAAVFLVLTCSVREVKLAKAGRS